MKKRLGHGSDEHYEMIDMESGEVIDKEREFTRMSLKPGIGTGFYEKYKSDIFPHDHCVVNGVATKPPKFYTKKLAKQDGLLYDQIVYQRELQAMKHSADNTPERLEVKEQVLIAKTRSLKREQF